MTNVPTGTPHPYPIVTENKTFIESIVNLLYISTLMVITGGSFRNAKGSFTPVIAIPFYGVNGNSNHKNGCRTNFLTILRYKRIAIIRHQIVQDVRVYLHRVKSKAEAKSLGGT